MNLYYKFISLFKKKYYVYVGFSSLSVGEVITLGDGNNYLIISINNDLKDYLASSKLKLIKIK